MIALGLKNGAQGTVLVDAGATDPASPGNVDIPRRSIGLNLTSRGIREACDVIVHRHRRLECLVTRWQPLIDDVEGGRTASWLLKPHGDWGISRKSVLLKNERTAGTTRSYVRLDKT